MKTNWGRKSLATLPLMSERECGMQRKNPLIGEGVARVGHREWLCGWAILIQQVIIVSTKDFIFTTVQYTALYCSYCTRNFLILIISLKLQLLCDIL